MRPHHNFVCDIFFTLRPHHHTSLFLQLFFLSDHVLTPIFVCNFFILHPHHHNAFFRLFFLPFQTSSPLFSFSLFFSPSKRPHHFSSSVIFFLLFKTSSPFFSPC